MNDHRLVDFLDTIYAPPRNCGPIVDVKQSFRNYLSSLHIEYVNYATFELGGAPDPTGGLFDTNMSESWIEEYLDRNLYDDDYVLARLQDLNLHAPHQTFRFGKDIVGQLDDRDQAAAPVLNGAADAGMVDAVGMIGLMRAAGTGEAWRCYSFGMGGEAGVAGHIEANLREIRVAISALMDKLRPEVEAIAAGFERKLTLRERDVLCRVSNGEHRETIGFKMGISVATVDMHLRNLRKKLRAQTLSEAVAKGFRFGILS